MQPRAETGQSLLELLEAGQKGGGLSVKLSQQSRLVQAVKKNRGFL